MPLLCNNREVISKVFQTADDTPGGAWKKNPEEMNDSELEEAVLTLQLKVRAIGQENAHLKLLREYQKQTVP
jgi:hypothetical protein